MVYVPQSVVLTLISNHISTSFFFLRYLLATKFLIFKAQDKKEYIANLIPGFSEIQRFSVLFLMQLN